MGRNSPRTLLGASGFMSYVSTWLGPPPRTIIITDFPERSFETAPAALSRRKSESVKPPRAKPPILRKPRREKPSQNRPGHSLKNVSILLEVYPLTRWAQGNTW